ncbi:hypothetical protein D1872_52220 [compost metagenome]
MFYAMIPSEMADDLTNRYIDCMRSLSEEDLVVLATQWEWYRKECGMEPMIPYYVFVVLMHEVYKKPAGDGINAVKD